MVPDVFLISAERWQSLTGPQQTIMREAAAASYARMNELWSAFEADARKAAERMGVTFTQPNKAAFAERAAALRVAFERMAKDEAFLAEMERTATEVGFMSGPEIERLIARVYAFPPEIVARMVDAISSKGR